MNAQSTHAALAIAAAAISSALFGCGGGAADGSLMGAAPVQMYQSFNDIATYCGLDEQLPAAKDAGLTAGFGMTMAARGGLDSATSVVSAPGGWDPIGDVVSTTMRILFRDFRTDTPTAAWIDVGYDDGTRSMGAQIGLNVPAGGIACVAPVAWLLPAGTRDTGMVNPSTRQAYIETLRTLTWASRDRTPLPVQTLPGYAVNGFEVIANYTPTAGRVYFSTAKTQVADQSVVRVCQLRDGASSWTCSVPDVSDNGTTWLFGVSGIAAGTYMLVSTHPGAGQ